MRVLVVNAGSSSLKLRLLGGDDELDAARDLALEHGNIEEQQLRDALADIDHPDAVGHRIVHGGSLYREPVRIDARVLAALRELTDLAPLHQPKSLAALDAVTRLLPDVPAGKLAIAEVPVRTREDVVALERAGVDAVIVTPGDVARLVGGPPPEV